MDGESNRAFVVVKERLAVRGSRVGCDHVEFRIYCWWVEDC